MSLPRIGVFDSGVGGLTVLRAMTAQFPAHYFYFGDTARLPYGTKSAETVARYASGAARFLEAQNIDLLVIACNSATALALPQIQQAVKIPVVGVVEPGAATASAISSSRSAVVIATEATVSSHAYREALSRHGMAAHEMACPLLVPLVEEGWIDHPVTEQVARIYLDQAFAAVSDQADVLVLACTHYPLLTPLLRRITPEHVTIVDSAESTSQAVRKLLRDSECPPERSKDTSASEDSVCHPERSEDALATERSRRTPLEPTIPPTDHRTFRFFVTDSTDKFKRLATRFLGRQVDHVEHVDLGG
jgi:glutamate racemase